VSVGTFAAAQLLRIVPRVPLSRAVGKLCELQLSPGVSSFVSRTYARAYGVNLDEVEACDEGYPCFDAFFTRRLKPGMRQVESAVLVSPADGQLLAKGPVTADSQIVVKKQSYPVAELIGDEADARRFEGGQCAVVYLSPRDYHRVHSPVTGEIHEVRAMPGDLYPVNKIGEQHVPGLFVRNQRVSIPIDTQDHGRVTVVLVGATIVGRITVTALRGLDVGEGRTPPGHYPVSPARQVAAGDEIGVFHLGSTAVVLVEAGLVRPGVGIERELGPIQYGQALVRG
jgi:phosphatidylserine decarboxylase